MAPVRCQRSAALAIALATLVYGLGVNVSPGGAALVGYVPGRVLVKFTPGTPASKVAHAHANARARLVREIQQIGVEVVDLQPSVPVEKAIGCYLYNPNVEYVELDGIVAPEAVPNDPSYATQWHLPRIGGPTAWDTTPGNSSIIVAILDTGVDPTHADLAPKMVPGWNIYDNNSDTRDVYGHGTATAGSAVAVGNNALGVASVAWNCRLMPIRISDTSGCAFDSDTATGLVWAADHGARVANVSYRQSDSYAVTDAAKYFRSKGGVVTMSAGNQATALTWPDNPYILTVGATDTYDAKASFSNTGPVVDVTAPGCDIYTTANGGGYRYGSGTSFSAPITAGVAALVLSANPGLSAAQVEACLLESADDLGTTGWDASFGWGRVNAAGAVALALEGAGDTQPPTVAFTSPANGATVSGVVQVQLSASDNAGVTSVSLRVDGGTASVDSSAPYSFSWDTTTWSNASHTLTATATDSSGNTATAQITVTVSNISDEVIDDQPPVAQISSPGNGSYVVNSVTVRANTSDNVGVVRVQLYVDQAVAGTSTSANPSFRLNTRKWAHGAHLLKVIAYDAAGNSAWSAPVTVYR